MDAIRLTCTQCGAGLKAPLNLAGKTLNCPQCQMAIQIPMVAATPAAETTPPVTATPVSPTPSQPAPAAEAPVMAAAMQTCPHCHAQIPSGASKCRHCGEFVRLAKPAAKDEHNKMQLVDYLVAVLFSPIGVVLGLIWLLRGYKKAGIMLLISTPLALAAGVGGLAAVGMHAGGWFDEQIQIPDNAMAVLEDSELYDDEGFDDYGEEYPNGTRPPGFGGGSGRSDEDDDEPAILRPPSEEDLANQDPEIQQAMRANVYLRHREGLGSGVIIKQEDGQAYILTNRHVVDSQYTSTRGAGGTPLSRIPKIDVTYVNGDKETGEVMWVGPDRIDFALIRADCPSDGIKTANCTDRQPRITPGEGVFAVGNPAGLGWTLTKGIVSQVRQQEQSQREVPIIQTDAAINPGNSGGGLYNQQGQLIGINNFIINPEIASSVGFAIRFEFLWELEPKDLD